MASPGRFELPAPRLGGVCSIQLSYGDIFDFSWSRMERSASQDFDDLIIRRRPLYPTELRGLIQKIFNFAGLQDSNDSIFRRRPLYPTELQTRMIKNILPFCQWICQCLICWERGGEKRLYSPPPSVIMGRKSGSDRRRRTEPVRNIEKRTVNLWTERRSSRAARCLRSSPGI